MGSLTALAHLIRRASMPVRYRIRRIEDLIDNESAENVGDFLVDVVGQEDDPKLVNAAKDLLAKLEAKVLSTRDAVSAIYDLYGMHPSKAIRDPAPGSTALVPKLPRRKVTVTRRSYGHGRNLNIRPKVIGQRMRASWNDQREVIVLEELPGKPHKPKLGLAIYQDHVSRSGMPDEYPFLPDNVARFPKPITASMTFDQALDTLETNYQAAVDQWIDKLDARLLELPADDRATYYKRWSEVIAGTHWLLPIELYEVHYLQVAPADTDPITVQGKDFSGTAKWTEFSFYSPSSDLAAMDPHYTQYASKSAAAARRFYQILKAKPDTLRATSWSQFGDWLRANKVAYETHHSVWH